MAARQVNLGIDLGTTSVKAALVEAAPGDRSLSSHGSAICLVALGNCASVSSLEKLANDS